MGLFYELKLDRVALLETDPINIKLYSDNIHA